MLGSSTAMLSGEAMVFVIKAEVGDHNAASFTFTAQKTMYGGKHIATGDTVYLFDGRSPGGLGLFAVGIVTAAKRDPKFPGVARQTPRVSVAVRRTALATRSLGRSELTRFTDWGDGRPETELNFKFYRQATNKIGGVSDKVSAYLHTFFAMENERRSRR